MFTGLHDIDWAAMSHAYGPASDVPALLRGLASDDPREREIALDGMYGAVHHQGDVYDSTLACIPFLFELVTDHGVEDRGAIVGLLASIGGIDIDDGDGPGDGCPDDMGALPPADEPDEEEAAWRANYAMAHTAVRASADVFFGLLTDPDPDVRREVPLVLTAWRDKAETVFEVLCERLPYEPDCEARLALVEAVGTLAVREPELAGMVGGWLACLAGLIPLAETEPDSPESGAGREPDGGSGQPWPGGLPWSAGLQSGGPVPGGPVSGAAGEARCRPAVPGPDQHTVQRTGQRTVQRTGQGADQRTGQGADQRTGQGADQRTGQGGDQGIGAAAGQDGHRPLGFAEGDPALRLAALAQLARCAPGALPADLVPVVRGLLRAVHDTAGPAAGPPEADGAPRPAAPTLIGHLRELRAQDEAGRIAPWVADLLHTLHVALGDRVADRTALLVDQLRGRDWGRRIDAVRMAGGLMRGRRGRYEELVALIGDQLADPQPRLADAAACVLEELFGLAAPAADALAGCLRDAPRTADPDVPADGPPPWLRRWGHGRLSLGPAPKALARLGDPRVLPVLSWALEQPDVPGDMGQAVAALGAPATALVPLLRHRLRQARLDDGLYDRADPLLTALAALAEHGDAAAPAVPEVLRVLRGAPRRHHDWIVTAAARTLGGIGPAAREAVPELRALLLRPGGSPDTALAAAAALWRIAPDPEAAAVVAALPLLRAQLAANSPAGRGAVDVIAAMGPAAAALAPRLRGLLTAPEVWLRLDAAVALWRVTAEPEPVLPVLRASWYENPHTRPTVARCARLMGPEAAPLAPFLRRELSAVRRHNHTEHHYASRDISADENLLRICREALFRIGV